MPGFDGTGPTGQGQGNRKGGGNRGYCNCATIENGSGCGGNGIGTRKGFGRGGGGRGFGRGFCQGQPLDTEASADELTILKQRATLVQNTLDSITSRIVQLEKI